MGRYPLVLTETVVPFPDVRTVFIVPAQTFAASRIGGAVVVGTALSNPADGKKFTLAVQGKNQEIIIPKICALAALSDKAENIITRPDHVMVNDTVGLGFFVIEEASLYTMDSGYVYGKEVLVKPIPADPQRLANCEKVLQTLDEARNALRDLLGELEKSHSFMLSFSSEINQHAFEAMELALKLAKEAYNKGRMVAFASYILLVFFSVLSVGRDVVFHYLNSLHIHEVDGSLYIDGDEYLNVACSCALDLAYGVKALHTAVFEIMKDELRNMRTVSLMRLRSEFDKMLGEVAGEESDNEVEKIRKAVETKQMPDEVKNYIRRELKKLSAPYAAHWAETEVTLKHINFLLELPWSERADEVIPFENVEEHLNTKLYGLRKAKDAVLDYLAAVHRKGSDVKGTVLCFVGPPGTGKTDMARCIADALKRPFVKISLGGVTDEAEIRGHRRTYVGALPGNIMKALAKAKVKNPVILLDEIDKIGIGLRGDPAAALMEVLDPEFNNAFVDHFVDFPFDLSEVFFICAANVGENIHFALRDRLNIIEFRPYTPSEKFNIAKHYLIPKIEKELGLEPGEFATTDEGIWFVIKYFTFESGVRELYRVLRKVYTRNLRYKHPVLDSGEIEEMLWDEPKSVWRFKKHSDYGVGAAPVLGVASYTGEGSVDTLMFKYVSLGQQEGNKTPADVEPIVTYSTDDLNKQTLRLAIYCAHNLYEELTGSSFPFSKWFVHSTNPSIRVTGTSFGVSAVLGALSAMLGKQLHPDFIFTGEIDVFGNIHPVGGIATKVSTAEACGYKRIYLPKDNEHDLRALDFTPSIEVRLVKHLKEIIEEGVFHDG